MDFPVELSPEVLAKAEALRVFSQDITEQFVRGSGAGGQKINKTSSCVRLRHLPTGLEVRCQEFRERELNRVRAYKQLIAKIETLVLGKKSARAQKLFKMRKQKKRRSRRAKDKMMDEKTRRGTLKSSRARLQ